MKPIQNARPNNYKWRLIAVYNTGAAIQMLLQNSPKNSQLPPENN